jgi:hypothetical protein
MSIVDSDGRPTMFFFRWLLTLGGTALTSSDLSILESFDMGAASALTESALTDALDAAKLAAALASRGRGTGPRADQRALESWAAADAPLAPAAPAARDLLVNIPTGLNEGDQGKTFYALDYQHWYRWSGAGWEYDDGELGSGFVEWFLVAPRAGIWQLCNGATGVSESLADGTAALVQFFGLAAGEMPDMITPGAYLRAAAAASGVVTPATNPVFAGGALTGATDLNPQPAALAAGSGAVASFDNPHAHTLPAFTSAGEPAHIDALPYYRL